MSTRGEGEFLIKGLPALGEYCCFGAGRLLDIDMDQKYFMRMAGRLLMGGRVWTTVGRGNTPGKDMFMLCLIKKE